MDSYVRFAPISSQRSTRLKLVVAYFALCGAGVLIALLIALGRAAFGLDAELRAALVANPLALVMLAATAGLFLLVGWQLYQRSRGAAVVAAIVFGLSVAGSLSGADANIAGLVLDVIGLLLIASVWGELRPPADSVARPGRTR